MPADAKIILIETESTETWIMRVAGKIQPTAFCEHCLMETPMVDLNVAVSATGIRASELLAALAAGIIHSPDTETGHLLLCLTSLKKEIDLGNRNHETPNI